jgi:hypothetical protein
MAAVSDRLSRAIPFNALKPFDRRRFAYLVAARSCASAHFAPLHRINHALTQVLRNRALPSPAGLRPANRLNQNLADSGIPLRFDPSAARSRPGRSGDENKRLSLERRRLTASTIGPTPVLPFSIHSAEEG